MAITGGVAIGTGLAAAGAAAAAGIRAAKQRTKPNKTMYGAGEDIYEDKSNPAATDRAMTDQRVNYNNNVAALGPRPPEGGGIGAATARAAWDQKKAVLDKSYNANTANIVANKQAAENTLVETGYDRAVNPLLDMQAQGANTSAMAQGGLVSASMAAEQQRQLGLGAYGSAAADQGRSQIGTQQVTTAGMDTLQGYQPGAVSQAMSRQVLDQNAQANLGAARASGSLGLRNALNANAQAGVGAAGQMATQAAQEQQQYTAALVDQANQDRAATLGQANLETGMNMQADEAQRQRVLQQQQLGLGFAGANLNSGLQASATLGNQGLGREQLATQGLDSIRNAQMESNINYDTRKQQEGQRKSDRLWQLTGGFASIAGGALGSLGKK